MSGEIVPNEDGYTLLHHFFVNYKACPDADQFFATLVERDTSGRKFTEKLTCFEETALDLAVMLKTEALHVANKHRDLFNFDLAKN